MTHDRIDINPDIMFDKPVIKGTRITVEQILRKLAGGMTVESGDEDISVAFKGRGLRRIMASSANLQQVNGQ